MSNLKLHVVSAGFFRPLLSRQMWSREKLSVNCLVIENGDELFVVDTGLHPRMMKTKVASQVYNRSVGIQAQRDTTLRTWIDKNIAPERKVKAVFLTHLHPDHTAGLIDFPESSVFLSQKEWDYVNALPPQNFYSGHFDKSHWDSVTQFRFLDHFSEDWFGFKAQSIPDLGFKMMAVDLPGHTGGGHIGYAIQVGTRWVLHAGDAYFIREDLNSALHERVLTSEMVQAAISPNTPLRHKTAQQLGSVIEKEKQKLTVLVAHEEKDSDQFFSE